MNAHYHVPVPLNEPVKPHAPGSPERSALKARLQEMRRQCVEIPLIIGGREIRTGRLGDIVAPHDHQTVLARYHKAGPEEIRMAVDAARQAWTKWSQTQWEDRVAIFLQAAELITKHRRDLVNAATMLGQSKTVHQAEIDATCELADFLRFNAYFMQQIYANQPENFQATWNRMEYRPLEGFIFAISPFNFTAIGGNLAAAPALMGNVVLWKPASTGVYSAFIVMRIFMEAGLPPGVINFVPGDARDMGDVTLTHPELSGVHFTGSNATFNHMWKVIADNIETYRSYPRIVGETGGKDFVVAHPSAEVRGLATSLIRGAFEYQGQKCSATSRAYIPRSLWPGLRKELEGQLARLKVGPVEDFTTFMGAIIDRKSFDNIRKYIELAGDSRQAEIIWGGGCDDSVGFFVEPTLVLTTDPNFTLMEEEIFGPVLTIYVYEDDEYESILDLCDSTSPYALTGAVFGRDRDAVKIGEERLRHAAGNFYINDKTTGAVVGHQPFGGGRASGTNDKAGSIFNLLRWVSIRTIKECFNTPQDFVYPSMSEE